MLMEVFGKFVVIWSFFGVISVFRESFIQWIAGLSDINEVTLLADCCVDDVFRSASAPIFDLDGDVLLRICDGLCRPYLGTKFAVSALLVGLGDFLNADLLSTLDMPTPDEAEDRD